MPSSGTGRPFPHTVDNRFDGTADAVVQADDIHGSVHIHQNHPAEVRRSLGDAYRDVGRLPEALDTYRAALAIWTETGDWWGEARTLTNLGDVLRHLGRAVEARAAWERSLAICDALGSPKAVEIRARLNQV